MGPKGKHPSTGDLFQQPLIELINLKHPLVKLADLIDWSIFEMRAYPATEGQEQTLQSACAGGGAHLQGQGTPTARVWRESDSGNHPQEGTGRWHALHAGQFL